MNDHSQMLNQQLPQIMNQQPLPVMNQLHHGHAMNGSIGQSQLMMNQSQALRMNRPYQAWSQPLSVDPNPNPNANNMFQNSLKPKFGISKPGRSNWKNNKGVDKRMDTRRMENIAGPAGAGTGTGGYKPPTLHELQYQNRLRAHKFYPKKKYNNRFAPYAPRNTTSFLIRAKKSGGIASLVSPCPVTPAVLPTPIFSPSREVLGDMAKEEWGVDGYGSMKGLIRLRSPGNEGEIHEEEEEEGGGSSDSDVEEHVEVERRLDHDLSRFEMIYPNYGVDYNTVLENRVDDQNSHIVQLEEENLTLKERLFLMERELRDLRRRLQLLERHNRVVEDVNEEVIENGSDNESEVGSDAGSTGGDNKEEVMGYVSGNREVKKVDFDGKEENNDRVSENVGLGDVHMDEPLAEPSGKKFVVEVVAEEDEGKFEGSAKKLIVEDKSKD